MIGIAAEEAMMSATGGVNAHRGAIFSLGLLCAAEGWRRYAPSTAEGRALSVRHLWGDAILAVPRSRSSNGGVAAARHGVGGARWEAGTGFPSIRTIALPALREAATLRPGDEAAPRVACFLALLAAVDDTNLLHRGGREGLVFAQDSARRFLDAGSITMPDWQDRAADVHHAFIDRHLSSGGCADLLAAALALEALTVGDLR